MIRKSANCYTPYEQYLCYVTKRSNIDIRKPIKIDLKRNKK